MSVRALSLLELAVVFVISIVPFLSAVAIAFLYESGFWMAIISGGRLFQALMLLGRNENL